MGIINNIYNHVNISKRFNEKSQWQSKEIIKEIVKDIQNSIFITWSFLLSNNLRVTNTSEDMYINQMLHNRLPPRLISGVSCNMHYHTADFITNHLMYK